mgnify:CR=1 FL=1
MKTIVMKFGGSSVANGEKIRHVANLIADNRTEYCGIVSTVSALEGVTNQLSCKGLGDTRRRKDTSTCHAYPQ